MDHNVRVPQHFSEGRVLAAGLIDTHGELLPGVLKTGPARSRFLAIDEYPLLLVEGPTQKNLLDQKTADE